MVPYGPKDAWYSPTNQSVNHIASEIDIYIYTMIYILILVDMVRRLTGGLIDDEQGGFGAGGGL